jgi:dihydrofolate reductase
LIDEFVISVIPILVGNGIRLFQDGRPEQQFELLSVKSYDTGLAQVHYRRKRDT